MILSNLHTAQGNNSQRYLDNCIDEATTTQNRPQRAATPQPRQAAQEHWTPKRIAKQIEIWACHPHTRPQGLGTYEQGMFRVQDIMSLWGTPHGLTTHQVIRAIKAHHKNQGKNRLTLSTQANHTMLMVHKTPPVGQSGHKVQFATLGTRSPKQRRHEGRFNST